MCFTELAQEMYLQTQSLCQVRPRALSQKPPLMLLQRLGLTAPQTCLASLQIQIPLLRRHQRQGLRRLRMQELMQLRTQELVQRWRQELVQGLRGQKPAQKRPRRVPRRLVQPCSAGCCARQRRKQNAPPAAGRLPQCLHSDIQLSQVEESVQVHLLQQRDGTPDSACLPFCILDNTVCSQAL